MKKVSVELIKDYITAEQQAELEKLIEKEVNRFNGSDDIENTSVYIRFTREDGKVKTSFSVNTDGFIK